MNTLQELFCVSKKLRSQDSCLIFLEFFHKHSEFSSQSQHFRMEWGGAREPPLLAEVLMTIDDFWEKSVFFKGK